MPDSTDQLLRRAPAPRLPARSRGIALAPEIPAAPPSRTRNRETWSYAAALAFTFAASLIASLFFKENWLWMDEVLSYRLISDPSLAHANDAMVSGMDANPPLFPNLYWLLARISLHPQFLRAVSISLFAAAIALFYRATTRLVGTPRTNAILISLALGFTYLNFTLSTQIRTYSLFLLVSCAYFFAAHRLVAAPRRISLLLAHSAAGTLLILTHNFGLFYLAASGAFFGLLLIGTRERNYLWALVSHAVIGLAWVVLWYPKFAIQTEAGKPHSWIPLPTLASFFQTAGELAPSLSSQLERTPFFAFLPLLRFAVVPGLFLWIALPRLRRGFRPAIDDPAFVFYLMAGFIYFSTLAIAVTVSFAHTSVFISRYLWPSHLLLIYQLVYAYHHFLGEKSLPRIRQRAWTRALVPLYLAALAGFIFHQNRKIVIFPRGVVSYLATLDPSYPVFVETADYFLPLWFHRPDLPARYLLDWESASRPGNILSATVEHKILKSFAEKYAAPGIVPAAEFTAENFPHFYIVDEAAVYGLERFLAAGRIQIVRELPIAIAGHRLLECAFALAPPAAAASSSTGPAPR